MPNKLLNAPHIADGAMGTLLIDKGFSPRTCLALLNITEPGLIKNVHRAYVAAGASIIFTHSFAANRGQLQHHGLAGQLKEINQRAVANARRAAGETTLVFASLGPTGQAGNKADPSAISETYYEQARVLIAEGVDGLVLETFTHLTEILAAITGCEQAAPKPGPLVASVSPQRDGRLSDGTPAQVWCQALQESSADIIGINCFTGPKDLPPVFETLVSLTQKPVSLKINAGLPRMGGLALKPGRPTQKKWIYPVDSDEFVLLMSKYARPPVVILGGCCGTTPAYIQKLATRLG